jgi:hypothetical protein
MSRNYLLFLGVGFLTLAGTGVFGFVHNTSSAASERAVAAAAAVLANDGSQTVATHTPPSTYLPYANKQFHFSVEYPSDLPLRTYDEVGGGFTAAFQDHSTHVGFEVYVTPYSGTQITDAQFQLDEPSGVIQDRTDTTVDGVQATTFFGHNDAIGDTREVWFIHGGFLYEVTTYKELDAWLQPILESWRFI